VFVTYLIVKLTLQAIVDECNRIAAEAETQERASYLKSRIAQLELDLATGAIDQETYTKKASEILNELRPSPDGGIELGGVR
jgi:uncharacterized protein YydD (DUF2326 family)